MIERVRRVERDEVSLDEISTRSIGFRSIVYCSRIRTPMSDDDLANLAIHANTRNRQLGIEGVLFVTETRFLQVLEGRHGALKWIYDKISLDDRHAGIAKILDVPIKRCVFSGWPMRLVCDSDLKESARRAVAEAFAFADAHAVFNEIGPSARRIPVGILTTIVEGLVGAPTANRCCPA